MGFALAKNLTKTKKTPKPAQTPLPANDTPAASESGQHSLLRFITCGSVDDGKSTLIGRMLYEAGAVESEAANLTDIIAEMRSSRSSERHGRVIDHDGSGSMEQKKQEGYF